MHYTLFDTPIFHVLFRWFARLFLFCTGWKTVGDKPREAKFVLIAAPHTSNWDLVYMIAVALAMRVNIYWMGKDSIFKFPFKRTMMWMGGIPIDRSQSNDMVQAIVDVFEKQKELVVAVPPEGTRSHTVYWKTGFYHIANNANIPICMGFLDYKKREGGVGNMFYPTGDVDKDMIEIKNFYKEKVGKFPDRFEQE